MYICSYTRSPRRPRLIAVFIILSIVVEAKCVIKSKTFISNLLAFLCRIRSLISSVPVTHPLLLVPFSYFFPIIVLNVSSYCLLYCRSLSINLCRSLSINVVNILSHMIHSQSAADEHSKTY